MKAHQDEHHDNVVRGRPARRARQHSSTALVADPPPPTHRTITKAQRGPRTVGDRELAVLVLLAACPGAQATALATDAGLTVGQVRYSLGILRENRLANSDRDGRTTVWTATR